MSTEWLQRQLKLQPRRRGFHLVTHEIVDALPELRHFRIGILHAFIQHTSASLIINENADPDVPRDLEASLNDIAPESFPYVHTAEGPDDMPAHVKAALLGTAVSIPVHNGALLLGVWQGLYLCEHRNQGGSRRVVVTIHGDRDAS